MGSYKSEPKSEYIEITEGFNKLLEKVDLDNSEFVKPLISSILVSMHPLFVSPIFSPNYSFDPNSLKLKNSLFNTLNLLGKIDTNSVIEYFFEHLEVFLF